MIFINKNLILFFLALALSILHWPFFFSHADVATVEIRYILWGVAIIMLSLQLNTKYSPSDFLILILISSFIFLEIILSVNPINNILSYYSMLLLIILYFCYLKSDKKNADAFIKYWFRFSIFVMLSSIIVAIMHNLINTAFDPLNFYETYVHPKRYAVDTFSIFGKTSFKESFAGIIDIERTSGYFNEPADLGFFALINLLIIKAFYKTNIFSVKNTAKWPSIITILAGLVSTSFTFYISLTILIFIEMFMTKKRFVFLILALIPIIILITLLLPNFVDLLSASSLFDRYIRISCGITILSGLDIIQNLFGIGLDRSCDLYLHIVKDGIVYNPGFSSGYMKTIIGRGMLALIFLLIVLFWILRHSKISIFFYLLYFLVISWNTQYIYLFMMLVIFSITHYNHYNLEKYRN